MKGFKFKLFSLIGNANKMTTELQNCLQLFPLLFQILAQFLAEVAQS